MMVIKNQVQTKKLKIYGTKDFSLMTLINITLTYNTHKYTDNIFSFVFCFYSA